MIVFFSRHIEDADKAGEDYLCVNDDISVYKSGASVKNIADSWITWMRVAFWNFVILSVIGVISINAAISPIMRKTAAGCGCFGSLLHFLTIIGLTIIRFSADG